jgi:(E)-4-hydroxy-3-methylbut-2-enyl-diphosphate synthase
MAVGALLIDKKAHRLVIHSPLLQESNKQTVPLLQESNKQTVPLLQESNKQTVPLLQEGLGEVLADAILQAARIKFTKTEYISCPGCGRTLYNLQETIAKIKAATQEFVGLKIGIMGCIVNGPGEMADADYGYVGAGRGKISLYRGKECVEKNIPEAEAVDKLLELIRKDRA